MEWNREWPMALGIAVGRWGQPVGVEEARKRWAELVARAESGTPTLITYERSGWAWAVLVPLAELYEPQWRLPSHPVSEARAKLADLIQAAHTGSPQLLRRHNKDVAAVMTADRVIDVPPGARLDIDAVLQAGATITLTFEPGEPGDTTTDGDVAWPPTPDYVRATATDPTGAEIATSIAGTAAEALALLHRQPTEEPIEYDTEPPF